MNCLFVGTHPSYCMSVLIIMKIISMDKFIEMIPSSGNHEMQYERYHSVHNSISSEGLFQLI